MSVPSLSILLFSALTIQAQMHDNNWLFGYDNAGPTYMPNSQWGGVIMHFEKGYPECTLQNLNTHYGVYGGVCSDSSGRLLFYTNGFNIRNHKFQLMQNGDTLNDLATWLEYIKVPGGYPSITGSVSVPAPGHPNCYYLIHTSSNADGSNPDRFPLLFYSFIDMNANNGLGRVAQKNKVLVKGDLPTPVLIKHGNGRDWWLLAPDHTPNTFRTFLIDPGGIHPLPNQEAFQTIFAISDEYAYIDVSPDGTLLAYNDAVSGLWLLNFDRCSGILSNPRNMPYKPPTFFSSSVSFSANSRYLYLGTNRVVYQLDLQNMDESAYVALDTVAQYNYGANPFPPFYLSFLLPQLAPDGKIYYITFSSTKAYHVINRPDMPSFTCDFTQDGLQIPRYRDGTWNYFPDYRLGKMKGSACDTLGFSPQDTLFQHTLTPTHKAPPSFAVKTLRLHPDFLRRVEAAAAQSVPENNAEPQGVDEIARRLRLEKRKKYGRY